MGFKEVLSAAGRAFLIAFGASTLALMSGVSEAPNLDAAFALGVAALFASIAAGIKAVQVYVPQISFGAYIKQPFGAWLDAFAQGGIGAFAVSAIGILNAPDLGVTWKTAVVAAVVGALQAGIRALQGAVTKGEAPFVGAGA